jgi:hypothetical protein
MVLVEAVVSLADTYEVQKYQEESGCVWVTFLWFVLIMEDDVSVFSLSKIGVDYGLSYQCLLGFPWS